MSSDAHIGKTIEEQLDDLELDDICCAMTHQIEAVNQLLAVLVMECTHIGRQATAQSLLYHLSSLQPVLGRISEIAVHVAFNTAIERDAANAEAQEALLPKED